jgi:hypothetical protein
VSLETSLAKLELAYKGGAQPEVGELLGVVDVEQTVEVVAREEEGADPHRAASLGSRQGANDGRVELLVGGEQHPALERAAGDLD